MIPATANVGDAKALVGLAHGAHAECVTLLLQGKSLNDDMKFSRLRIPSAAQLRVYIEDMSPILIRTVMALVTPSKAAAPTVSIVRPADYEKQVDKLFKELGNETKWPRTLCRRMLNRCAYDYDKALADLQNMGWTSHRADVSFRRENYVYFERSYCGTRFPAGHLHFQ